MEDLINNSAYFNQLYNSDIKQLSDDLEENKKAMRETLGFSMDEFNLNDNYFKPAANFADEMLRLIDTTLEPFETDHFFNKNINKKPYFDVNTSQETLVGGDQIVQTPTTTSPAKKKTVKFNKYTPRYSTHRRSFIKTKQSSTNLSTTGKRKQYSRQLLEKNRARALKSAKKRKCLCEMQYYRRDSKLNFNTKHTKRTNPLMDCVRNIEPTNRSNYAPKQNRSKTRDDSIKDVDVNNVNLTSLIDKFNVIVNKCFHKGKPKSSASRPVGKCGRNNDDRLLKTRIPIKKGSNLIDKISHNLSDENKSFLPTWIPFITGDVDRHNSQYHLNYCFRKDKVDDNYNRIFENMKETDEKNLNVSKQLTFHLDDHSTDDSNKPVKRIDLKKVKLVFFY